MFLKIFRHKQTTTCVFLVLMSVFVLLKIAQRNNGDRNEARYVSPPPARITATPTATPDQGPIPIILLTYMRSGSSFLGEVLQADPNIYYLFEPLHAIQFKVRENATFTFLNGTSRRYDSFLDVARITIAGLSTCDMEHIPLQMWLNGFLVFSKKAKEMRYCVGQAKTTERLRECLSGARTACMNSKHAAFKIIRIPVALLESLMTSIPRLRMLHLVRDPRATVLSQLKSAIVRKGNIRAHAVSFCNRVYRDVIAADHLDQHFPGRTLRLYYEDVANDPIGYAQRVYDFAEMNFTPEVESKIRSMTSEDVPINCTGQFFCTVTSNSSLQAVAWRMDIPFSISTSIDDVCQPLYSQLGYRRVSEAELRDISFQLRDNISTVDDFRYA